MIKITIELLPHGFVRNKKRIAVGEIWNDLTSSSPDNVGNYGYRLLMYHIFGRKYKLVKEGRIKKFPRLTSNIWDLLSLVMKDYEKKDKR